MVKINFTMKQISNLFILDQIMFASSNLIHQCRLVYAFRNETGFESVLVLTESTIYYLPTKSKGFCKNEALEKMIKLNSSRSSNIVNEWQKVTLHFSAHRWRQMLLDIVYTARLLDDIFTTKIDHFTVNDGDRWIEFKSIFTKIRGNCFDNLILFANLNKWTYEVYRRTSICAVFLSSVLLLRDLVRAFFLLLQKPFNVITFGQT